MSNDMQNLVTLKEYCATHGIDYKRARRAAKAGKLDGAFKALGRYAIAADAPVPELPAKGTGGFRARADGRSRYNVYMTADELAAFTSAFGDCEVIDPKVKRAERRAARKAAKELADNADDGS